MKIKYYTQINNWIKNIFIFNTSKFTYGHLNANTNNN